MSPRVQPHLLSLHPLRDMLRLLPPPPGKWAASPEATFRYNRMEPCGVRLAPFWFRMNIVESVMAACGSSMPPAFALAVRARCAASANERKDHGQTAPGQRPASSASGGIGSDSLARLEPATPAASLPASASPAPLGSGGTGSQENRGDFSVDGSRA